MEIIFVLEFSPLLQCFTSIQQLVRSRFWQPCFSKVDNLQKGFELLETIKKYQLSYTHILLSSQLPRLEKMCQATTISKHNLDSNKAQLKTGGRLIKAIHK